MLIPFAFLNYGLARHCRWDLHLLIMGAAFLFGCHSFRSQIVLGCLGKGLRYTRTCKPCSYFGSGSALKEQRTASSIIQSWIKRGNFWICLSGPCYVNIQLIFTPKICFLFCLSGQIVYFRD